MSSRCCSTAGARSARGRGSSCSCAARRGSGSRACCRSCARSLAGEHHRWFETQCTPYTSNTPLYPYGQILAQAIDLPRGVSSSEGSRLLREALAAFHIDRPDLLPSLERLLALRGNTDDEPACNPKAARDATFQAIFTTTKRAGEAHPLVIVLEDLHWADPTTFEMLQLAHAVRGELRVLLICTMRPELEMAGPARENAMEIQLGPLDREQTRSVAEFVAAGRVAPAAIDAIVARADGNPLFASELARHARETGSSEDAIPASLHDSLMARLDRLGDEKRLAQVAAVGGRSFSRAGLRVLPEFADERVLDEALHRLEEEQLIVGTGLPLGAFYEFRHVLIRDVAYESIPPRRRAALHAETARAIEAAHPDWSAQHPEVLARHFDQAGASEAAATAWERAADRALATSANVEAIRQLERALAATSRIAGSRERDEREIRLLLKLGRSLLATREHTDRQVERTFSRVHALCRGLRPSPSTFGSLSEIWVHRTMLCDGRALQMAAELMEVAVACGDRHLEALAEGTRAQLSHFAARHKDVFEAAARAREHLADARQATGSPSPAVDALSLVHVSMARSAWLQGAAERARREADRAIEVARALANPYNESLTDSLVAYVYLWRGEDDRALEIAERNLARATRHGFGIFEAAALGVRGEIRLRAGRPHAALEDIRADLEILRALGTTLGLGLAHLQLAQAFARARAPSTTRSLPRARACRSRAIPKIRRCSPRPTACSAGCCCGATAPAPRASASSRSRSRWRASRKCSRSSCAPRWRSRAARVKTIGPLAAAYARFREGFDTADLAEARSLLASARPDTNRLTDDRRRFWRQTQIVVPVAIVDRAFCTFVPTRAAWARNLRATRADAPVERSDVRAHS